MTDSSKINFNQLRQDNLKDVFQIVEKELNTTAVDFYVIGAIAKDTWFLKEKIRSRATKDVDIAVMLSDESQYQVIKENLVREHKFVEVSDNAYKLITPFGYPIDIVPFGALELNESVKVDGEGLTVINVNGFKEVFQKGIVPIKIDDSDFQVATLPSLVLLKFISYDDRPEQRIHDIEDIAAILHHFFDIESDLIYNHHNDLFSEDDRELIDCSAIVIGREIGRIIAENAPLKERLLNILQLKESNHQQIPEIMAGVKDLKFTVESATTLLNEIAEGIKEAK